MIAVLQRADRASVCVDGEVVGAIGEGLLVLLGVSVGDTERDVEVLARKILACRIFCDEGDKKNLSVRDIGGSALVISNFTLLANCRRGNRPDYAGAARAEVARPLYEYFVELLRRELAVVQTGRFGAHMDVSLQANGPVTIVLDSHVLQEKREK